MPGMIDSIVITGPNYKSIRKSLKKVYIKLQKTLDNLNQEDNTNNSNNDEQD